MNVNTLRYRKMYPGSYQYKFIIDDNWTYSADHLTTQDGTCINNLLEVGRPDHTVCLYNNK